jgi:hypothetical protein
MKRPHELTLNFNLAAVRPPATSRGGLCRPTSSTTSAPTHVVPRDARCSTKAHRRGRGARRLRHDCREGICGILRAGGQRRAARPGSAPPPASCTCASSRTATPSPSSPGAPGPSRSARTCRGPGPSTASSRPAATSRSTPARARTPTPSRAPKADADAAMDAAPASAAGPAWPPAPTPRPCSSPAPRSASRPAAPGPARALRPRAAMVAQMDAEGFGGCTNHRRVRSRLPQGDHVISQLNADLRKSMARGH